MNTNTVGKIDFHLIGWKSYNKITKKAMEQEFSWSGLIISLSIAFLIVLSVAFFLRTIYDSVSSREVKGGESVRILSEEKNLENGNEILMAINENVSKKEC